MTRRGFLGALGGVAAGAWLAACGHDGGSGPVGAGEAHLTARPGEPTRPPTAGAVALGLDGERDALLYVPATYSPLRPPPLAVLLHGAGGDSDAWGTYFARAEARRLVLLIPASRGVTWDLLRGGYGPDVAFLDRALAAAFDRCRVDTDHVALAGFSDGASYALSLGTGNGDLFTHLIAYAPGLYAPPAPRRGHPSVFVAHGRQDTVLSVTRSRSTIVPRLRAQGYAVTYQEFDGGHQVPAPVSEAALDWFAGAAEPT